MTDVTVWTWLVVHAVIRFATSILASHRSDLDRGHLIVDKHGI